VFCNDASQPLVGEKVEGISHLSLLSGKIGGSEAKFHCPKDDFEATLEALGASKGTILFLECKMVEPAKCKLSTAQEASIKAEFTGQVESAELSTFKGSGAGEEFTSLTVEGEGCAIPGTFPVTGTQMVDMPTGGSSLAVQEIVALKRNSKLLIGQGNKATFSSTALVKLRAHPTLPWLIMKGE
ncbi:MAG: hypothetical protein WA869_15555, partial [Alloacidobacterium sp.]